MPQKHFAAELSAVPPGKSLSLTLGGRQVGLFNVDGRLYAIDNICPHAGAPLADGSLSGKVVTCPWHAIDFDVTSGKAACGGGFSPLDTFPVTVDGNRIEVEV